jgi:hypothetical protein
MAKYNWQTFDDAVTCLRELRGKWKRAEADFIRACMALEDRPDLWQHVQTPADPTFGRLLERVGVVGATTYEQGSRALRDEQLSALEPALGMAAVKQLNEVRHTPHFEPLKKKFEAYVERKQIPVPERNARADRLVMVGAKIDAAPSPAQQKKLEVADLEKQLAAANRRIAELEAENLALRERLSAALEATTGKRAVRSATKKRNGDRSQVAV